MKKTCERCKTEFSCGANNATKEPCWCFGLPPVDLSQQSFVDCLCQNCLLEFQKKSIEENKTPENKKQAVQLVEKEDYYFENGLMVLTEAYLKKRGFCCDNGCRHCPY